MTTETTTEPNELLRTKFFFGFWKDTLSLKSARLRNGQILSQKRLNSVTRLFKQRFIANDSSNKYRSPSMGFSLFLVLALFVSSFLVVVTIPIGLAQNDTNVSRIQAKTQSVAKSTNYVNAKVYF
jgi:hypothetical protein